MLFCYYIAISQHFHCEMQFRLLLWNKTGNGINPHEVTFKETFLQGGATAADPPPLSPPRFSLAATSAGDSVKNFFARPSSSLNSIFYLLFSPITDILHLFYVTSLPFFFRRDNSQGRAGMERWGQSCRRRRWGVPQEEPLTYTGPLPVPASEDMGCGLRKLEDPEDSSPGKIYSTLKRPQVETKSDIVYEYVLLDFSLEGRNHGNEGGSLGNIQHWF